MAQEILKEFNNKSEYVNVQLVQGWDGDEPMYYATEIRDGTGLTSRVFNPNNDGLKHAQARFAKLVRRYL